ncbi:MAG: DUF3795 domain-containing protein [Methanomassiliicoccaceae archaeon]|jgi:hypothetical protein|nr:DUF3795 domain-containing protein [Methanomassiliicoccaceae archaeon]
MNDIMEKIIAYCGINCAECNAYLATKNDDQKLRERTAAEWTKLYNFNFTPEMINCTSCTGSGVKCGYCSQCEVRKCAVEKKVRNCGACSEFKTCKTINGFLEMAPDLKKNLTEN